MIVAGVLVRRGRAAPARALEADLERLEQRRVLERGRDALLVVQLLVHWRVAVHRCPESEDKGG